MTFSPDTLLNLLASAFLAVTSVLLRSMWGELRELKESDRKQDVQLGRHAERLKALEARGATTTKFHPQTD